MDKVKLIEVVSKGSHARNTVDPELIIGDVSNGYDQGDILDANATGKLVNEKIHEIVGNAAEALDTLEELGGAIPTKVSDLTNDAGYLTSEDISELSNSVSNIQNLISADESDIDVAIDKFEEIVDFLDGIEPGSELYTIIHSHIDNGASGVIKHVEVLTQAQYDAMVTKDPNTEYNII